MVEDKYWITTQIRMYYYKKIQKLVGKSKEIPNPTRFINLAIKEKLEKLELRGKKK